jgi:hypothetical protein
MPSNTHKVRTSTGFEQLVTVYQAKNCHDCPLRSQCHKSKGNRKVEINHNLKRLKIKAKEYLTSEIGLELYPQRCIEPEPVFGNLKQNKRFKRFTLRGLAKVDIEFGLMAIAHNFAKWYKQKLLAILSQIQMNFSSIFIQYRLIKHY